VERLCKALRSRKKTRMRDSCWCGKGGDDLSETSEGKEEDNVSFRSTYGKG
jgi:hypothetical protein